MRKWKGSHAVHPNLLATSFFVDAECNNNCSPRGKPCFKQGFQGRAGSSTSNSVAKRLSGTTEPTGYQLIRSYRQRYLARRQSLLCAVSRRFAVTVPAATMLTIVMSRVRRILPQRDSTRLHRHDILMRCQEDRLQ